MIPGLAISSSWLVEDGWTTQVGGDVKPQRKTRRLRFKRVTCSACGQKGHLKTTCGLTDEERAAKRRKRPPKRPTASSEPVDREYSSGSSTSESDDRCEESAVIPVPLDGSDPRE